MTEVYSNELIELAINMADELAISTIEFSCERFVFSDEELKEDGSNYYYQTKQDINSHHGYEHVLEALRYIELRGNGFPFEVIRHPTEKDAFRFGERQ